jgi:hypothetical protein
MPSQESTPSPLPHLKPDELTDRDYEESILRKKLSTCWSGDDFDIERANHVMQGAAELIFDVGYKARQNRGYQESWLPEIVIEAVFRTLTESLGYIRNGIPNLSIDKLGARLEETIWAHIEELKSTNLQAAIEPPTALTGKQALAYELAGIDTKNPSPLVRMAMAQANAQATPALVSTQKAPAPSERTALLDAYRKVFPDAGIMDICFAARQHYHEWHRWLNGKLKDGCKADRLFRSLLLSGKSPRQMRPEVRPKDYR